MNAGSLVAKRENGDRCPIMIRLAKTIPASYIALSTFGRTIRPFRLRLGQAHVQTLSKHRQ
jgi:hypothetical protein